MPSLLSFLTGAADLAVVLLAFSLIIVLHELGHFLAARWAGIRVLAFAVGFGPALVSYRRGLGWRRGSSEPEYNKGLAETGAKPWNEQSASPTEYRLNALPFGGYVKMLGQDDGDAGVRSDEPDSYQMCIPWKRMVVISAGVAANLVTAVLLFITVFTIGLTVEPARIGPVESGSPAATTVASNASALGVAQPGLRPGDEIVAIDGERPNSFNDLVLASAMAHANSPLHLDVRRPGVEGTLRFDIIPREDESSHLLAIGVGPAFSGQLLTAPHAARFPELRGYLASVGLADLQPGMRLVAVNGRAAGSLHDIDEASGAGDGQPVSLSFRSDSGRTVDVVVRPTPALERDNFRLPDGTRFEASHLLGLMPVLAVREVDGDRSAAAAGLKNGDVFVQLGSVEWPSVPMGVAEIRKHKRKPIRVVVARDDGSGHWGEVDLGTIPVDSEGRIGFNYRDSGELGTWVARMPPPAPAQPDSDSGSSSITSRGQSLPSGAALPIPGGSRILSVNGRAVRTFADIRSAIVAASTNGSPTGVDLRVQLPIAAAASAPESIAWMIPADEAARVRALAWESPLSPILFEPDQVQLKSDSIAGAAAQGFRETRRVMTMAYITFARLFQGSVKVEHLKGPVGIAHVGVMVLERGWVWLMFYMALISVNLSVINFLPIPIADGGHMVYLIYEQITGKPPPVAFQNAAALAGIILLGAVFLLVTFHDVGNVVRSFWGN